MVTFTELCLLQVTYLLIQFKENKGSDQLCLSFCTYENCLIWHCLIGVSFGYFQYTNLHRNSKNMHFCTFFLNRRNWLFQQGCIGAFEQIHCGDEKIESRGGHLCGTLYYLSVSKT